MTEEEKQGLIRNYAVSWVVIKSELARIYENNWSYNDFLKFSRASKMDKRLEKVVTALYKENQSIIKEMLKVNYIESVETTKGIFKKIIPIKKSFDVVKAISQPVSGIDWFMRLGKNKGDILYDLSGTIKSGIQNGLPYSEVTKNLQKAFNSDLIKNDTIARTETRRVKVLGQTDVCDELAQKVPLVKTWNTMEDERVRSGRISKKGRRGANHAAMNNVTIPYEEDFITPTRSTGKAPTQLIGSYAAADNINCFPGETFVAIPTELEKGYKRYYEGELITIETAGGIKLSGTPNHPVLTDNGWVALKFINTGDNVICGDLRENSVSTNPDIKDEPTVISEVFDFVDVGFTTHRTTGAMKQFHGDGFNSEIDIVDVFSELRNKDNPSVNKPFSEDVFMLSNFRKSVLNSNSSFDSTVYRLTRSKKCLVSFFGKSFSFFKSTLRHPEVHGIASISLSDSRLIEDSKNNGSATVKLFSELLYRKPGMVKVDNVVRVDVSSFNGHVYNLQTKNSFYVASSNITTQGELKYNGIISHNCRCLLTVRLADK